MNLENHRVLVTGANGFLGRAIRRQLNETFVTILAPSSKELDLRKRADVLEYFMSHRPSVVIHCAVQGGGIGWMKAHPVESGQDNYRMGINVLEASHRVGTERFVGVSSACIYPKYCEIPFHESQIWSGFPEPTNASYALSKRAMMELGRAYYHQHGMHTSFPILANLYGPGDHLDPTRAHVVADLMIRCSQSPESLIVWGSGTPTREFIYIDDAAKGVLACLDAPPSTFVNIGTGVETPILELAKQVIQAHGLDIPVLLDPSKPDGQPRKVLDVQSAFELLNWSAETPLEQGLRQTAQWYRAQSFLGCS